MDEKESECIESYELNSRTLTIPISSDKRAWDIKTDYRGVQYFELYRRKNGSRTIPKGRSLAIVEPWRNSITDIEAGSEEIEYIVSFYHGVV